MDTRAEPELPGPDPVDATRRELPVDASRPELPVDATRRELPLDATRRELIGRTTLATAALLAAPVLLTRKAGARPAAATGGVLVHVFLRGGSDGLAMVPPYADPDYYTSRPTLAIPPPGQQNGALPLPGNSFFGLAPAAAPLLTPYNDGKLLIVNATGLDDATRSHFDAQRYMELGTTGAFANRLDSGWIARHLSTLAPPGAGLLRGIALEDGVPFAMDGAPASLAIPTPSGFLTPGRPGTAPQRLQALGDMFRDEPAPLGPLADTTVAAIQLLGTVDFANYVPANGAVYPATPFGDQMRATAAMIKAGLGIEVFAIDYDRLRGWDHHAQLGPITGGFATKLSDLARGLEAFYLDLRPTFLDAVTVVVLSEFGRRVSQNASNGTDHGHGNSMMVMGGRIIGGRVLTNWPGLAPAQLDDGDLAITLDHRDILAELVQVRLGNPNLGLVFPAYTPTFHGIAY